MKRLEVVLAGNRTRWEASTLEKSHSNSVLMAIRNIYIWARDQWRMLATKNRFLTWIPRVEQRPGNGSECDAPSWSTRWPRTRRPTSGAAPWPTSPFSPCPPASSTTRTRTFSHRSLHSPPKGCLRQHRGDFFYIMVPHIQGLRIRSFRE